MKHYIIPLFIPHAGCPYRCVFCDQKRITGQRRQVTAADIKRIIEDHLAGITKKYYVEAAFYGGTFTALPVSVQEELIAPAAEAYKAGKIDAIRLSTRPDAIDEEGLRRLKANGVKTIELGAQSFSDELLAAAGRGHTAGDIFRAAELIKGQGIALGIQLMPGLPGETADTLNRSVQAVREIMPSVVRLYPVVVIRDTPLADMYERGEYVPLTLERAAAITAAMKLSFEQAGIRVIRTGLQSSEELDDAGTVLAGPYHPAFGELVENEIYWSMLKTLISNEKPKRLIVYHESADTSKLRGVGGRNMERLKRLLPETELRLYPSPIGKGEIMVDIDGRIMRMSRKAAKITL